MTEIDGFLDAEMENELCFFCSGTGSNPSKIQRDIVSRVLVNAEVKLAAAPVPKKYENLVPPTTLLAKLTLLHHVQLLCICDGRNPISCQYSKDCRSAKFANVIPVKSAESDHSFDPEAQTQTSKASSEIHTSRCCGWPSCSERYVYAQTGIDFMTSKKVAVYTQAVADICAKRVIPVPATSPTSWFCGVHGNLIRNSLKPKHDDQVSVESVVTHLEAKILYLRNSTPQKLRSGAALAIDDDELAKVVTQEKEKQIHIIFFSIAVAALKGILNPDNNYAIIVQELMIIEPRKFLLFYLSASTLPLSLIIS